MKRIQRRAAPDSPGVVLAIRLFLPAVRGHGHPFVRGRELLRRLVGEVAAEILELSFEERSSFQGREP
jgi:hypothetical protein